MENEGIFEIISKPVLKSKFRLKSFIILIQLIFIKDIFGFNVAPEATYVTSLDAQQTNSYFGYSVGLLRNQNGKNWLLVGAPLANSSGSADIYQPGAFYKCLIDKPERECQEVYLDRSSNFASVGQIGKVPFRNSAWTGAALDIDDDGNVLVCAPRWKNAYYFTEYRVTGACYLIGQDLKNNSALFVDPLLNNANQIYILNGRGVYYYAHGQTGMSVHFTKDSDLLLGSPGVLNWQGSVAKLIRQQGLNARGLTRREASFTYSTRVIPNPLRTSYIHDSNFLGYSITSGKFSENNGTYYVGGAPRGASSNGMVLIFLMKDFEEMSLDTKEIKNGTQLGEYFGGSVAAPDLNGDGLSDLVVGAPLHSVEGLYDVGCIYVYNTLKDVGKLEANGVQLFGDISQGARFGLALGTPGDLDRDGYEDFLVGAPYENENESNGPSGAVYVFMGSKNGVRPKYLQKLVPERVSRSVTLKGFGVSFSRPLDVDENTYPDFAVGSFLSDKAVLMSTRPVIIARGELSANPPKLSLDKNFFILTTCLAFDGEGFREIAFKAHVFLSQESESGEELVFFNDLGTTERVEEFLVPYNKKKCQEFKVDLKLEKSNAQNPVSVRMEFELKNKEDEGPETPVISPHTLLYPRLDLSFVTGCKDDFCRSDLVSTARIKGFKKLLIGKISKITLEVETVNKREPAFLPNITINIPKPIIVLPSIRDCSIKNDNQTTNLVCQLKNPLKNDEKDIISLDLDVSQFDDFTPDMKINVSSNSATDFEENPDDNNYILNLLVEKNASISVSGYSIPEQIIYERITEDQIKSNQTSIIKYSIEVAKSGFTPLQNVEVEILIPRNVTLPTGEMVTVTRELEFQVSSAKSKACSLHESNTINTFHDPNNDKRFPSLSTLNCLKGRSDNVHCSTIKCSLGPWRKANDVAQISISFRVNFTSLGSVISPKKGFNLLSYVIATVSTKENVTPPKGQLIGDTEIQALFVPGPVPVQPLALWIYLVAILCGFLLLLIIAFILYKAGFFRRKAKEELEAQKATLLSREEFK